MKITSLLLFAVFLSIAAHAEVPPQRLMAVGEELRKVYEPLARKNNTTFQLVWKPEAKTIVNATGGNANGAWQVSVYGGMMSHPLLTEEAFRFILCHEMGHIIGGEPTFAVASDSDRSSNAGQPDYFAAAVCMKLLLKDANNFMPQTLDPVVDLRCRRAFSIQQEQDLCRRIGNAGNEFTRFLLSMSPTLKASYATPSRQVVTHMESGHPDPQCRLDTVLAGALCKYRPTGASANEGNLMNAKCNTGESTRPRCWFVP